MDRCLLATERRSETRVLRSLYRFRYRKFRVSLHFFAVAVRRRSTADCISGKQVSHPLLPHDSVSQYVHLRIADVVFFVFEAQISTRAGGRPPAESDEKSWKLPRTKYRRRSIFERNKRRYLNDHQPGKDGSCLFVFLIYSTATSRVFPVLRCSNLSRPSAKYRRKELQIFIV